VIRLIRLHTGPDGQSHVERSTMPLGALGPDTATGWLPVSAARFQSSPPGSALDWHDAPRRQYVVTLTGTIEFTTRGGETFRLRPGVVLLAEDTAGGGHRWRLVGDEPWTRVYLQLP
jgi:hypothetical protein